MLHLSMLPILIYTLTQHPVGLNILWDILLQVRSCFLSKMFNKKCIWNKREKISNLKYKHAEFLSHIFFMQQYQKLSRILFPNQFCLAFSLIFIIFWCPTCGLLTFKLSGDHPDRQGLSLMLNLWFSLEMNID